MQTKRTHDVVCDQTRRDRAVVDSRDRYRFVLQTTRECVPIGELKRNARGGGSAINKSPRVNGQSARKLESDRNKEMMIRELRSVDVRRESIVGCASRLGYPHAVVETDVSWSTRRGCLNPLWCRELRDL